MNKIITLKNPDLWNWSDVKEIVVWENVDWLWSDISIEFKDWNSEWYSFINNWEWTSIVKPKKNKFWYLQFKLDNKITSQHERLWFWENTTIAQMSSRLKKESEQKRFLKWIECKHLK